MDLLRFLLQTPVRQVWASMVLGVVILVSYFSVQPQTFELRYGGEIKASMDAYGRKIVIEEGAATVDITADHIFSVFDDVQQKELPVEQIKSKSGQPLKFYEFASEWRPGVYRISYLGNTPSVSLRGEFARGYTSVVADGALSTIGIIAIAGGMVYGIGFAIILTFGKEEDKQTEQKTAPSPKRRRHAH